MKNHNYAQEFRALTQDITESMEQMADPVSIATMLYTIAEEKKSGNLVIKDINSKFDQIISKLDKIATLLEKQTEKETDFLNISDRDEEILEYIKTHKRVCADDLQNHFKYKGRNAASARLNKLFHNGLLEKIYAGKTVYYQIKNTQTQ